jgi:hypothetical protein
MVKAKLLEVQAKRDTLSTSTLVLVSKCFKREIASVEFIYRTLISIKYFELFTRRAHSPFSNAKSTTYI